MSAKAEKTEEKGEGAKKKKLPLPMIIGVVVLVVALLVGKSVMGGGKKHKPKKEKVKQEMGISLPLDEFLVNLNGSGDHYLRAQISLGLKKGMTEEQGKEEAAPMRDAILSVLSTKTLAEVAKPKDREDLKEELKKKINAALEAAEPKDKDKDEDADEKDPKEGGKETVLKVYFTAFATQ